MTERYFVTGTDTEVGKTVASTALLQAARALGRHTAGYKPVASGSEMTAAGLRNSDALALQRNSSVALSYPAVNPYTFAEPTSPHIISADAETTIQPCRMLGCEAAPEDNPAVAGRRSGHRNRRALSFPYCADAAGPIQWAISGSSSSLTLPWATFRPR